MNSETYPTLYVLSYGSEVYAVSTSKKAVKKYMRERNMFDGTPMVIDHYPFSRKYTSMYTDKILIEIEMDGPVSVLTVTEWEIIKAIYQTFMDDIYMATVTLGEIYKISGNKYIPTLKDTIDSLRDNANQPLWLLDEVINSSEFLYARTMDEYKKMLKSWETRLDENAITGHYQFRPSYDNNSLSNLLSVNCEDQ